MIRRVLGRLAARFAPDERTDEEGSGFVPSPLDRSVREAHGGNYDGAANWPPSRSRQSRWNGRVGTAEPVVTG